MEVKYCRKERLHRAGNRAKKKKTQERARTPYSSRASSLFQINPICAITAHHALHLAIQAHTRYKKACNPTREAHSQGQGGGGSKKATNSDMINDDGQWETRTTGRR